MKNPQMRKYMGGTEFLVGDCRIWAGIFYLDSPTSYREYLPESGLHASDSYQHISPSKLQLLDEAPSPISRLVHSSVRILLSCSTSIRKILKS